MNDKLTEPET